jgi:hypothetical protein
VAPLFAGPLARRDDPGARTALSAQIIGCGFAESEARFRSHVIAILNE